MNSRTNPFFLILAASALVCAQPVPRTVAVLPFEALGTDSTSALMATQAVSDELSHNGKVRLLERSQASSTLAEKGFAQPQGCQASECATQAGRLLDVQDVVLGTIAKLGDAYSISVRLVDVRSAQVVASVLESSPGALDTVIATLVPRIASTLISRIPVDTARKTAPPKKVKRDTLPMDPWTARHKGFHPRVELLVGFSSMLESPLAARLGAEINGIGISVGMSPLVPMHTYLAPEMTMTSIIPAITAYYGWKYLQFELTYSHAEFTSSWHSEGIIKSDDYVFNAYAINSVFDIGKPGGLSVFLGVGAINYKMEYFGEKDQTATIPMIDFGFVVSN